MLKTKIQFYFNNSKKKKNVFMTKRKREMLCTNNMNGIALDMPECYYPTRIIIRIMGTRVY